MVRLSRKSAHQDGKAKLLYYRRDMAGTDTFPCFTADIDTLIAQM